MKKYLTLVKFSHTIFALPFALIGFFQGILYAPELFKISTLFLVLGCMVFARSAAMAFNRFLDRDIDAYNPRTASREIPSGQISPKNALLFVIGNSILFILTTWFINEICFYLSPVALLITLGYSYTKRFTVLCHFVLGLGLALAPIGAFLAVTGKFDWLPILYSLVVLFWVSGFDIIYALQDQGFDKKNALFSVPAWLGTKKALQLSAGIHTLAACLLIYATYLTDNHYPSYSWLQWAGTSSFSVLLIYQHTLVRPGDLSRVNQAFFATNGMASLLLGTLFILDFFI